MDLTNLKYLVVGSGFFGSVIAERIANVLGEKVLIIDKRKHIGGNCFTEINKDSGVEVHKYGSHLFHTSDEKTWKYINQFTAFNSYQHRVLTIHKNQVYSMPINLMTINNFYKKNFNPAEAMKFLKDEINKDSIAHPSNLHEKAISLIGRPLYEAFIQGYTQKQWQTDLKQLPENIITRLPVRYNFNDRYFNDTYEGLPIGGYTEVFKKMLTNANIEIKTDTDYFSIAKQVPKDCKIIYTGPIDRFFNYKFGRLGWRTLRFEEESFNVTDYQGTSVMNYADLDVPFTRIHEFKHLHPERKYSNKTTIFREFSLTATENSEPFYPVNTEVDKITYQQYVTESTKTNNVIFGGRLGNYVYLDMHQVISSALNTFETKIRKK